MHVYPSGTRRPIAYASRTLKEHEKRYGQIDKDALAIMVGLKRFHLYLCGRYFTILIDHKPLECIFGPKTAIRSLAAMRLQRSAIFLAAFNYSIKFVPSKQNTVADALSHLPLPSTTSGESAVFKVKEHLADCLPVTHKERYICTPALRSLGTVVPHSGIITSDLCVLYFRSAMCSL